jgi:hypothetical protein
MPRTEQNAAKSTGGSRPRQQLQKMTAAKQPKRRKVTQKQHLDAANAKRQLLGKSVFGTVMPVLEEDIVQSDVEVEAVEAVEEAKLGIVPHYGPHEVRSTARLVNPYITTFKERYCSMCRDFAGVMKCCSRCGRGVCTAKDHKQTGCILESTLSVSDKAFICPACKLASGEPMKVRLRFPALLRLFDEICRISIWLSDLAPNVTPRNSSPLL